jgi:hypothetical protein
MSKRKLPYSRTAIALEAEVHRNTVQAYFSGLGVSDESKSAIEKAIKKLNKKYGVLDQVKPS